MSRMISEFADGLPCASLVANIKRWILLCFWSLSFQPCWYLHELLCYKVRSNTYYNLTTPTWMQEYQDVNISSAQCSDVASDVMRLHTLLVSSGYRLATSLILEVIQDRFDLLDLHILRQAVKTAHAAASGNKVYTVVVAGEAVTIASNLERRPDFAQVFHCYSSTWTVRSKSPGDVWRWSSEKKPSLSSAPNFCSLVLPFL